MIQRPGESEHEFFPPEEKQVENELGRSSQQNPDAEGNYRHLELPVEKDRARYHAQVEKDGRERRGEKMPDGIQNSHGERRERYEQHVGKHEPV